MLNLTLRSTVLAVAATLLTSCGGSSDSNNASENTGNGTGVTNQGLSNGSNAVCGSIDNSFSYDVSVSDGRERRFHISSPVTGFGWDGSSFCDMDNSVGVTSIAVLIPETNNAPVIDGQTDFFDSQWDISAYTGFINNVNDENITKNLLESSVQGYFDGARPGEWFATHDNENLYIRFLVRNEGSSSGNNQHYRDSADPRNDDSIDIFIDGDNSKGTSFDGVNDFHTTIAMHDDDLRTYPGPNSATTLEISYGVSGQQTSQRGWYEVKVGLQSAGILVGRPFGFEVQLNDDDNGGLRDAKFGWFEPSGSVVADSNPSVFGTVLLTGCAGDTYCGANQLLNPGL